MRPRATAFTLLQGNLKAKCLKVYLRVLSRLLDSHRQYSFLEEYSSALRSRDFKKLYEAADSLSKQLYSDATQHFVANQFALLVKKYPWPSRALGFNPEQNARDTFWKAEKRSARVNRKFRFINSHRSRDRELDKTRVARRWIRSTIGGRPSYSNIFDMCDFGGGASVGVHGDATHILAKLNCEKWSVTPGALHHGFGGLSHNFHYSELLLERGSHGLVCLDPCYAFAAYLGRIHEVNYNKISFVPKTAKTLRTIAVEPLLNGFVQKGIDLELRKKLLSVGLDLSDQGINQEFARQGSISDSEDGFVTIDLSSASDSVSIELCRYLLPDDWFRLLWRTRSPSFILDSKVYPYDKMCSMGNGFCFPLETLLFAAACISSGCGTPGVDFTVYGDDIIVRKRYAHSVLATLKHWGFTVNRDKTFLEGPFRESCGSDWFGGEDVRPFTLDFALDTVENVFKFLNLSRRSERTEKFFSPVRSAVIDCLPKQYQFFRPLPGQEDTGIDSAGDEHLTCPNCHFSHEKGKWTWKELSHSPISDFSAIRDSQNEPWLIGVALRGSLSVPHGLLRGLPGVSFRNRFRTKVVRKGYVSTSNWLPPLKRP